MGVEVDRDSDGGEVLEGHAEEEAPFVLAAVVADDGSEAGDPAGEVSVDGVLLEFEGTVCGFEALVHAEAPVFGDAGVGTEVDEITVLEEGMVLEEAVTDGEVEVLGGHEDGPGIEFGEAGVAAGGDLSGDVEAGPWHRVPFDFLVEVGDRAVVFRVGAEDIDVGVGLEPVEGAAVAFGLEAVVDAEADDVPVLEGVDGGVVHDIEGPWASGEGEAVDAFEAVAETVGADEGPVEIGLDDVAEAIEAEVRFLDVVVDAGEFEGTFEASGEERAVEVVWAAA